MNDESGAPAPETEESAPESAPARQSLPVAMLAVAALFLLIGFLVGRWSGEADRENTRAWLNSTLQEEFARQETRLQEMMLAARPPDLNDSSTRFAVSAGERPALGPAEASVEIIEFGDFNCGFCARFHSETLPQILESYGDQVRIVYRDFPILGETSTEAAIAARCAGAQGQFWPYHDLLFENPGTLGEPGIFLNYASTLDLDPVAFNDCLVEQQPFEGIAADFRDAQELGIRGTPAFFINGRPLLGAREFEAFARIIDEELAAVG